MPQLPAGPLTQRVGALSDHYLARDRPLGVRCSGIGPGGTDARALRGRLDFWTPATWWLLRGLQDEGLIR